MCRYNSPRSDVLDKSVLELAPFISGVTRQTQPESAANPSNLVSQVYVPTGDQHLHLLQVQELRLSLHALEDNLLDGQL